MNKIIFIDNLYTDLYTDNLYTELKHFSFDVLIFEFNHICISCKNSLGGRQMLLSDSRYFVLEIFENK